MHRALKFFLPLLLSFSQAWAAPAPQGDVFPLKIHEKELANGLRVMVIPTGFPNLVSLQIPVQTGSRNEVEEGKTGFAHFFEHMMFRGTKNVSSAQYQEYLNAMGARQNAYTSGDLTNYHTTFAKDDLELMLRLEADRFQNLQYGESEFKTEARAVLGEYNKNSASPGSKLWEVMKEKAFTTHTYKHTTMGFLKDIEDMPNQFEYSKIFFDRWYRPEYTTLIIAGDVSPEKVFPLVQKYFGSWQRGRYKVDIPVEPPAKAPVYSHVPWESPTLPHLVVAFRGPAFNADNRDYAALQLFYAMAFGESSDLYKRLVIDEQKVNSLSGMGSRSKDPDLYPVYALVKDPRNIPEVRNAILKTFAEAVEKPVDQVRLDAVRSNYRYSLGRSLDNTESIAAMMASYVHYERRSDTLNRLFRTLDQVTVADIQRVARQYFTDNNLVVTTLAKDNIPAESGNLPKLSTLLDKPLRAASAPIKTIAQKNKIPVLNVKLLFRTGSAHDPVGKEGLSYFASQMVSDAGSQAYRYDELKKALFPLAAGLSSRVDKEMTTFTLRMHKDHGDKVLSILLPSLLRPGFRDEDFQRLKAEQLNDLKTSLRTNNEEELGKERLQELVFAGTRYAHPVLGTVAGIESITMDDVKSFIARAYAQNNLTIGVNGDASDSFIKRLQGELTALPAQQSLPELQTIVGKRSKGLTVNIVQKNTRATAISLGHPLEVTRAHPDFAALWLARAWLGEHRSSMSHLYERIREVRGMNYGDYAYIEAFPGGMFQFFPPPNIARRAQLFEIWLRPVQPENAHMALRIALFELDRLVREGLTEKQFAQTRDYLLKNVFVMTATQDQQIGYALDSDWFGIGEYTSTLRDRLSKLTLAEVNQAIRKYFSSQDLQVVMITQDAKGLKEKLVTDAVSTVTYDGVKPQQLLDEDKVIGALKLQIDAQDVTITPVDDVFAGPRGSSTTSAALIP
jgi:zinc protease